jgi:hypothetical protein
MLDGVDPDVGVWITAFTPTLMMVLSMSETGGLATVIREAVQSEVQRAWGAAVAAQCQCEVTLDAATVGPLSAMVRLGMPGSDQGHTLLLDLLSAPPATRMAFVRLTTQQFLAGIADSQPPAAAENGR